MAGDFAAAFGGAEDDEAGTWSTNPVQSVKLFARALICCTVGLNQGRKGFRGVCIWDLGVWEPYNL